MRRCMDDYGVVEYLKENNLSLMRKNIVDNLGSVVRKIDSTIHQIVIFSKRRNLVYRLGRETIL